ncbi:MAG TPA: LON peptidase substrate-binding domain-containing protein [Oscillatoriaceae cyanobacterium]
MSTRVIPLFPLKIVLFPGMLLPLRIFEPRYRLMVQRCLESDGTFGVSLIQEGEEVGGGAIPSLTGTLAEISKLERLDDGELMLLCVGLRRFRIERLVEGEPYPQAEVAVLDEGDPADPVPEALLTEASTNLEAYLAGLSSLTTLSIAMPHGALSSIDLSYLMAATLQVERGKKQAILETPDVIERLQMLVGLFRAENERMEEFLAEARQHGDIYYRGRRLSLN